MNIVELNATLFVQAIHFFIAYLILRFLLFKPSIQALDKEHEVHDALRLAIVRAKEHVDIQEQERQEAWNRCYGVCKEQQPQIDYAERAFFKGIAPRLRLPTWNATTLNQLVEQTSQAIIKRLKQA